MATIAMVNIAEAVAALNISGVDVYDLTNIPEQADTTSNAQLFPDQYGLVQDMAPQDVTLGAYQAEKNLTYRLNYILAYKPAGAGYRATEYIPDMMQCIADVLETLNTANLTAAGAITHSATCLFAGMIDDPAGNRFIGARLALTVLEFMV